MRVDKFKVERYRSIEKSESIDLNTLSVLVGPNNEGKSNILRAVVVGLRALARVAQDPSAGSFGRGTLRRRIDNFQIYNWERDFPLTLQTKTPGASSVFEYEFELNEDDLADFKKSVGHSLNGQLKLRVLIDKRGEATIKIVKRGPGNSRLNANIRRISEFLSRRVRVEYIPAARTAEESLALVRHEFRNLLQRLSQTQEYQSAVRQLDDLAKAALLPLEDQLLQSVRKLVPSVQGLTIDVDFGLGQMLPDRVDILLNDGLETSLATKGDGIQSLVAIALLRTAAASRSNETFILALEEPEAHLHPGAVRELAGVLDELATEHQVILTTHSPILVRRDDARANIIVQSNSAAPSRSLAQVRKCLGVEMPDNMVSAEVTLLVEGAHDVTILRYLLSRRSQIIASALKNGRLVVRDAGGAQSVPYFYHLLADSVFSVHVVLDDDSEGRSARQKLDQAGVQAKNITMLSTVGMTESELEDLFDESLFTEHLDAHYNVKCDPAVTQAVKRFSLRMKDYFASSGQAWSSSVASSLKSELAAILTDEIEAPVPRSDREPVLAALTDALVRKLSPRSRASHESS